MAEMIEPIPTYVLQIKEAKKLLQVSKVCIQVAQKMAKVQNDDVKLDVDLNMLTESIDEIVVQVDDIIEEHVEKLTIRDTTQTFGESM